MLYAVSNELPEYRCKAALSPILGEEENIHTKCICLTSRRLVTKRGDVFAFARSVMMRGVRCPKKYVRNSGLVRSSNER